MKKVVTAGGVLLAIGLGGAAGARADAIQETLNELRSLERSAAKVRSELSQRNRNNERLGDISVIRELYAGSRKLNESFAAYLKDIRKLNRQKGTAQRAGTRSGISLDEFGKARKRINSRVSKKASRGGKTSSWNSRHLWKGKSSKARSKKKVKKSRSRKRSWGYR